MYFWSVQLLRPFDHNSLNCDIWWTFRGGMLNRTGTTTFRQLFPNILLHYQNISMFVRPRVCSKWECVKSLITLLNLLSMWGHYLLSSFTETIVKIWWMALSRKFRSHFIDDLLASSQTDLGWPHFHLPLDLCLK